MDLYNLGSIFLDISIGILVLGAIIRLILAITYSRKNGSRVLTDDQRKKLRRIIIPIAVLGLLFSIAAMILLVF